MESDGFATVFDAPEGLEFRVVGRWPHGRILGTSLGRGQKYHLGHPPVEVEHDSLCRQRLGKDDRG